MSSMKRVWVGLFVGIVWAAASTAAAAEELNWPQWQGPTRDCMNRESGLLKKWPEGGPPRKWLYSDCGAGYSGPAVVDGRLYIMGTRDGANQLFALDAETGTELWKAEVGPDYNNDWGGGPRGTPAVDGDRIYALGPSGTLICAQVAGGKELWRVTMESLGGKVPTWGFAESVLVDGNLVLCTPGGPQGAITAFDKMTGKIVWRATDLTEFAHYSSIVRGEINGKPQYVQLLEKRLVGVAPDSGKLLWQVDWGGSVAVIPTPIVRGNRIFVTSGYGAGCMLVEVNSNNQASKVYENKRMKSQHGGVIELNKFVYGFSDDVGWVCLDARTGDMEWREREALGKGAIGYADGRFYCVDQTEGDVVLIDASPKAWTERGRFRLEPQAKDRSPRGGIWVHPVVVNGLLYLRDQEHVYCYDVKK